MVPMVLVAPVLKRLTPKFVTFARSASAKRTFSITCFRRGGCATLNPLTTSLEKLPAIFSICSAMACRGHCPHEHHLVRLRLHIHVTIRKGLVQGVTQGSYVQIRVHIQGAIASRLIPQHQTAAPSRLGGDHQFLRGGQYRFDDRGISDKNAPDPRSGCGLAANVPPGCAPSPDPARFAVPGLPGTAGLRPEAIVPCRALPLSATAGLLPEPTL